MEFFARFRRTARDLPEEPAPLPAAILPAVNDRVTLWIQGHSPSPSRVEDESVDELVVSFPNLALVEGDQLTVSWEAEDGWYSLDTHVSGLDEADMLPTVRISTRGRLARHDERRGDLRMPITLPLELRIVMARVVKGGRMLQSQTVELSPQAVRFSTSAPFAPGDMLECRLTLGEGDVVAARLRVIRMDTVSGSWRQTCTCTFDDILRSDRSRIIGFLENQQRLSGELPLEQLRPAD